MADEIRDAIQESAIGPKKVQGDEGTVEQHSLSDQIAADKYLAAKTGTRSPTAGLKFLKISPPGAV